MTARGKMVVTLMVLALVGFGTWKWWDMIRMNLGLGVNPGIRRFKEKWGAGRCLPYVETSWETGSAGFFARLFRGRKAEPGSG